MAVEKYNVLHLFNQYLPQTENWAYHLISNIPSIKTYVAARGYQNRVFFHPDFIFYKHLFSNVDRERQLRRQTEILGKIKWRWYQVCKVLFNNLKSELIEFSDQNEIDLIHAHFADVGWYFRKIARRRGLPFVISFYGWDYEMLERTRPKFKKRIKRLFQEADAIICEGPYGAGILRSKGCPQHKIRVIPLGVRVDQIPFVPRKKATNRLKLIQIASFTEKKGYSYTIKAFHKALVNCPNMELTLVGGESQKGLRKKLVNEIEALALGKHVKVLSSIEYKQLHHFMSSFHVFIHPSYHAKNGDCEGGAPIVLLDAQATGMPVISTNHCDVPSEVQQMKTGILTKEKDISALVSSIKTFYEMTDTDYQTYALNARAHVENRYDIRKNATRIKTIYDQLLTKIS